MKTTVSEGIAAVIAGVIVVLAVLVGVSALAALPVMWLWNAVVPDIFHLTSISFLQAWGLSCLSAFMFKSVSVKT